MRMKLAVNPELALVQMWFACELNTFVFYLFVFYVFDFFVFQIIYESLASALDASRIYSQPPMLASSD